MNLLFNCDSNKRIFSGFNHSKHYRSLYIRKYIATWLVSLSLTRWATMFSMWRHWVHVNDANKTIRPAVGTPRYTFVMCPPFLLWTFTFCLLSSPRYIGITPLLPSYIYVVLSPNELIRSAEQIVFDGGLGTPVAPNCWRWWPCTDNANDQTEHGLMLLYGRPACSLAAPTLTLSHHKSFTVLKVYNAMQELLLQLGRI